MGANQHSGMFDPNNGGRVEPCGGRDTFCPGSKGLAGTSRKRSAAKSSSWLTGRGLRRGDGRTDPQQNTERKILESDEETVDHVGGIERVVQPMVTVEVDEKKVTESRGSGTPLQSESQVNPSILHITSTPLTFSPENSEHLVSNLRAWLLLSSHCSVWHLRFATS